MTLARCVQPAKNSSTAFARRAAPARLTGRPLRPAQSAASWHRCPRDPSTCAPAHGTNKNSLARTTPERMNATPKNRAHRAYTAQLSTLSYAYKSRKYAFLVGWQRYEMCRNLDFNKLPKVRNDYRGAHKHGQNTEHPPGSGCSVMKHPRAWAQACLRMECSCHGAGRC